MGFRTTYGYDSAGRQNAVTNARGFVTTSIYSARDLIATEDALGNMTTYGYNAAGSQILVTDPTEASGS